MIGHEETQNLGRTIVLGASKTQSYFYKNFV
jgi:hypothetical protein